MTRRFITAMLLASGLSSSLFAQDRSEWRRGGNSHAPAQQQPQHDGGHHEGQPGGGQPGGGGGDQHHGQPQAAPQGGQPQFGGGHYQPAPQGQPHGDAQQHFENRGDRGGHGDHGAPPPGDFSGRSPYDQHSPYDHPSGDHQNHGGRPDWQHGDQHGGRPDWNAGADHRNDHGWQGQGYDRGGDRRWDNGWRSDRRYDWRGFRDQHRDVFRGPRYYAPQGWSYRRYAPGVRIAPFLFAQQYWIDDPYDYRLPPAYGPYRWVRYYDDVLLVDLRSGVVVESIPDFFY